MLELIEALEVGDAIPSERLLGIDLGVSRLTVRAALDELVREGRLTRRRGAGTFVAEPKVAKGMTITLVQRRHAPARAHAGQPHARVPDRSRPARASAASCTSRRPSPCSSVKRLRLADGEPMAIELLHVREALFPGLTARDLEESSFYDLLEQPLRDRDRRRHADGRADRDERGGVGGARRPAALAGPALRAGHALGERATIVEFTSSIYRGDRYRLVSELGVGGRPALPVGLALARSTASRD